LLLRSKACSAPVVDVLAFCCFATAAFAAATIAEIVVGSTAAGR
jgi:hypothetical protein